MADGPHIRACVIPDLNTRIIDLALDVDEQGLKICSMREAAIINNRAEDQIDTNIGDKLKTTSVPIVLRKRTMCERLTVISSIKAKNKEKENIKKENSFNINWSLKKPVPIMQRKFLLYQLALTG